MLFNRAVLCSVLGLLLGEMAVAAETTSGGLILTPSTFVLHGRTARQHLLVTRIDNGRPSDLTRKVVFRSNSPAVARVSADGIVTPVANGEVVITAT
ncbi:MAG TPA: Ig-like domain-containing protein, partial [Gemmataceae bacterium]